MITASRRFDERVVSRVRFSLCTRHYWGSPTSGDTVPISMLAARQRMPESDGQVDGR